jgi:hypothetical protein
MALIVLGFLFYLTRAPAISTHDSNNTTVTHPHPILQFSAYASSKSQKITAQISKLKSSKKKTPTDPPFKQSTFSSSNSQSTLSNKNVSSPSSLVTNTSNSMVSTKISPKTTSLVQSQYSTDGTEQTHSTKSKHTSQSLSPDASTISSNTVSEVQSITE